jgi:hypothetical protein
MILAGAALVLACARRDAREDAMMPGADAASEGLIPSLAAQVDGDTVRLNLHVTNATSAAVELEYGTAQRFDFAVLDEAEREVWRWSEDEMFAQVVGSESLGPGETVEHEAEWHAGGRRGEHVAVGRLTSTNRPIELRTRFEIPVR